MAFFLAHLLAFPTRKPVISSTSSRKYSRTGCVKPRMNTLRTAVGTTPAAADAASGRAKYAAKKSASAVALISTTRKSLRSFSNRRNSNNNRSDSTLRSCTSSSTTCVTPRSAGSDMSRRSKMPIVQKCKRVLSLSSLLSNRTEYPTTSPHFSRRSAATRSARPMALMRRGCVHTMFVSAPRFSEMARSRMNWGTCVDLPQPVSPDRTTTGAADTAAVTSSREPLAGRFARLATIFAAEASAERAPPPFPFPPRVDPKYASCASFRRTFSFSMNSLEGTRDRCAPRLLSRGAVAAAPRGAGRRAAAAGAAASFSSDETETEAPEDSSGAPDAALRDARVFVRLMTLLGGGAAACSSRAVAAKEISSYTHVAPSSAAAAAAAASAAVAARIAPRGGAFFSASAGASATSGGSKPGYARFFGLVTSSLARPTADSTVTATREAPTRSNASSPAMASTATTSSSHGSESSSSDAVASGVADASV